MTITNVPQPTFGATGFISPSESAIFAGVQEDQAAAFAASGYVLNPALNTPQGQLATSMAAIIGNTDAMFLYYTSQTDPAFAQGRMQDAIGNLYFMTRIAAQSTVVQAICSGASGVVIPTGALAVDTAGNLYACTGGGTIGVGGTVTLSFACVVTGPIICAAGALNQIYQAIPGWDSITNAAAGATGSVTESRNAFEIRRQASVALNSVGALPSILAAVLAVPNVLSAYVTENASSSPLVIGDYTLAANSVYVAAVGGTASAVAQAIWSRKAPGCAYNGNTTVVVQDTSAGYEPPYPSYNVTFNIPTFLPVIFAVSIVNSTSVPSNAAALIQAALVSAFSGGDGGSKATIAGKLYATRFVAPIAALGAWAQVISVLIGSGNASSSSFTASISGTNMTVTAVASGTLAAGQFIVDSTGNVTAGTTIVSQTSGTAGGTGVYVVSNTQTVASEAMKGFLANVTTVTPYIDQMPSISTNQIVVTLI